MIGEVVGSYRIMSTLGKGGMGIVYMAEHPLLGNRAVVKMLLPELSEQKDVVERFFNEAKAATRIKHPGIVQVFDFGYHPDTKSAYIIMEMLDGETLNSRIQRVQMTPVAAAVIARKVASALTAAHSNGIVHRDLKPDNIFLVADPDLQEGERVKVLDFGIAKLAASQSARQTRTGEVFGTPLYMSPEQCENAGDVDARTDIYALGCILYEMLIGHPPFVGGGVAQLVAAQMFHTPTRPSQLKPGIPPALETTILRALEKSPDKRQQSMVEIANELDAIIGRRVVAPVSSSPDAVASTMPSQHALPVSPEPGLASKLAASDAPRGHMQGSAAAPVGSLSTISGGAAEVSMASRPRARVTFRRIALLGLCAVLSIGIVVGVALTRSSRSAVDQAPQKQPLPSAVQQSTGAQVEPNPAPVDASEAPAAPLQLIPATPPPEVVKDSVAPVPKVTVRKHAPPHPAAPSHTPAAAATVAPPVEVKATDTVGKPQEAKPPEPKPEDKWSHMQHDKP